MLSKGASKRVRKEGKEEGRKKFNLTSGLRLSEQDMKLHIFFLTIVLFVFFFVDDYNQSSLPSNDMVIEL